MNPLLSLHFSSAGKGPFMTSKAKNMCQRSTVLAEEGGGDFAFMEVFIFQHPVNQLTEKYFLHLKTKNFTNRVCLCHKGQFSNKSCGSRELSLLGEKV